MHTSVQAGYAVFNTGGTFGSCTMPSNWDVVVGAIIAMAKCLWLNCSTVVEQAAIYLPTPLEFEAELYELEGGFLLAAVHLTLSIVACLMRMAIACLLSLIIMWMMHVLLISRSSFPKCLQPV